MANTELDIFADLGFAQGFSNRVAVYVANKDRKGVLVDDYDGWVSQAAAVLATLGGGGATVIRNLDGYYLDTETGQAIPDEKTALVYSYVTGDGLKKGMTALGAFIDKLATSTDQSEIGIEINGKFAKKRYPPAGAS